MNVKSVITAQQRRAKIANLIQNSAVESQSHLVKLLAKAGVRVTQATASRDLEELGAIRVRSIGGELLYELPETNGVNSNRGNEIGSLISSVTASGNLAVIKTPPGGAQLLAGAIDRNGLQGALKTAIGTLAGDDTVLVVSSTSNGGAALAKEIIKYSQSFVKPGVKNKRKSS